MSEESIKPTQCLNRIYDDDRKQMLCDIKDEAADYDVPVEVEHDSERLVCTIRLIPTKGPHALIILDGDVENPGSFVIHWHVPSNISGILSPVVFDAIEPYHGRESTELFEDFLLLIIKLEHRLAAIKKNKAIRPWKNTTVMKNAQKTDFKENHMASRITEMEEAMKAIIDMTEQSPADYKTLDQIQQIANKALTGKSKMKYHQSK